MTISFQKLCYLIEQAPMPSPGEDSIGAPPSMPQDVPPQGLPPEIGDTQPPSQKMPSHKKNKPTSNNENAKIAAIKSGLKVRPQHNIDNETFWDDFIKVTGDAKNLAHLLGISRFQISGWASKIKKYLRMVKEEIKTEKNNKKHKMMKTGDQGAAGMPPMGGDENQVAPQGGTETPNPLMGGF